MNPDPAAAIGAGLQLFAAAGYDPIAPGWPGEPGTVPEAMQHPELVANTSIDDITAHYTKIIDSLDASRS